MGLSSVSVSMAGETSVLINAAVDAERDGLRVRKTCQKWILPEATYQQFTIKAP
jgi:hypothetical protein